jgi:hypothetical protein
MIVFITGTNVQYVIKKFPGDDLCYCFAGVISLNSEESGNEPTLACRRQQQMSSVFTLLPINHNLIAKNGQETLLSRARDVALS